MRNHSSPLILALLLAGVIGGALWTEFNRPNSSSLPSPVVSTIAKTVSISSLPPHPPSPEAFPLTPIQELKTFRHGSGIFSMIVPKGWRISDRLENGKLVVTWIDPAKNSVISVEIFATPADTNKAELIKIDQGFIKSNFGAFPGFFVEANQNQTDGSVRQIWGYTYTNENKTARAVINRFLQQKGEYTVILSIGFVEQHYDRVQTQLAQIANSFQLNPTQPLPTK